MSAVDLQVRLIGSSRFVAPDEVPFDSEVDGGQALSEFAGRAVYQSWARAVPATATNAGFLAHILQVGHLSVLEHATATCYVTGLSRAAAHELIRHRHLSVSQLSPRTPTRDWVTPAGLDAGQRERFDTAAGEAARAHAELLDELESAADDGPGSSLHRKQARQVAAGLLPSASATAAVVTGNYRAWRHFIGTRATDAADVEVRGLAVAVLRLLQSEAPHVFADFRISRLPDGTETAASPLLGEG
jgi:thymidylate synthase (FAD)